MSNTFSKERADTRLAVLQLGPRSTKVSRTLVLFVAATVAWALAIPAAAQGARRHRAPARSRPERGHARRHRSVRSPLAGAGEEMGLRAARPDVSCTERRDRHDAGWRAALVRSRHGLRQGVSQGA